MERTEETYKEYSKRIRGVGKKNNHPFEIRNSWGVYDYFKYYRKKQCENKKSYIPTEQYYKLIRTVNSRLCDVLLEEKRLELPLNMGTLEVIGFEHTIKLVDGKVKTSRMIDWYNTLKLWYEDPEAEKNKTLIRFEAPIGVSVKYRKRDATYPNKSFYGFVLHREKKNLLSRKLKNNSMELPYFVDTKINAKALYDG